jgi:uncharacterized protein with HEPN domain
MPRDSRVYLEDILTAVASIRGYVAGSTRESLDNDKKTVDAVVRNLEIIGEAVEQLPVDAKRRAPEVEWQKIAGMRDVLIHAYQTVDLDIVWDVVTNKLPALEQRLKALLAESEERGG